MRPLIRLKYEDTAALRRRALRRRLLSVLILLAAAKLFVVTVGERAWTGALALFWQERCLAYRLPEDRLAYVAAPQGTALPAYLADFSRATGSTWHGTIGAPPYPVELAELQKLTAAAAVPWEALPGPVFLHGLRDARGRQKLVTVYALADNPAGWWTLVAAARDPVGLRRVRRAAPVLSTACWPMPKSGADALAVFAGQPDPTDPSRFTLRVSLNGRAQTVTGALQHDGTIVFISTSGLTPWGTDKAGPIVVPAVAPRVAPGPYEPTENVLLPTD